MKKKSILGLLLMASATVGAQENPLWMRYPAISPDGSKIAFSTISGEAYIIDINNK